MARVHAVKAHRDVLVSFFPLVLAELVCMYSVSWRVPREPCTSRLIQLPRPEYDVTWTVLDHNALVFASQKNVDKVCYLKEPPEMANLVDWENTAGFIMDVHAQNDTLALLGHDLGDSRSVVVLNLADGRKLMSVAAPKDACSLRVQQGKLFVTTSNYSLMCCDNAKVLLKPTEILSLTLDTEVDQNWTPDEREEHDQAIQVLGESVWVQDDRLQRVDDQTGARVPIDLRTIAGARVIAARCKELHLTVLLDCAAAECGEHAHVHVNEHEVELF